MPQKLAVCSIFCVSHNLYSPILIKFTRAIPLMNFYLGRYTWLIFLSQVFATKKNPSPLYFWIEGLIIPGNSLSKFVAWNRLSLKGFFVDVKNRRLVLFLPEYLENWGRKSREIAHVIHQTISIHLVTYICCRAELTLSYFKGLIFFFRKFYWLHSGISELPGKKKSVLVCQSFGVN